MEYVQPIRDKKQIQLMKEQLSKNPRDLLLFNLGINSGLRISDILSMKVSDVIDPKGKVRDRYELRETKTGKSKNFIFNDNLKKSIEKFLKGYQGDYDRPLFISTHADTHNKPLTRQQAYNVLNHAADYIGITDRIGCHTTRKTFGYWAYKSGVDISKLQQIFNHSAPSVTLRYIGIQQDDIDDVYINLNL